MRASVVLLFASVSFVHAFEWVGEGFGWLATGKTNLAERIVEPEAAWEALSERGETLELPDQLFEAGKAYANLYRKTSVQQQIDELSQRLHKGQGDRLGLMVQMGNLQIRNRQFDLAVRTFLNAALEFPTVETPVERLAFCLLSLGDHAGGYRLYHELAQSPYPSAGIVMNYGAACYNVGKLQEAVGQYRQYIELRAADWKGAYNLGAALFALADFEAAEKQFRKAHDLAPSRPYGLLGQAWVREMLQDNEGFESLKRELERRIGDEDTAQILARPRLPAFLADTPVFPLNALEKPMVPEVRKVWLNHLVAQINRTTHDLSRERLLRECLRLNPKRHDLRRVLYDIYVQRKEGVMGGMTALAAIRYGGDGDYWKGEWKIFADYFIKQQELTEARMQEEGADVQVKAFFSRAEHFAGKGQYGLAEVELRRVLARYPRWPRGLLELGRVYVGANQAGDALNLYELANLLFPQIPEFSINYGSMLFAQDFHDFGIAHMEKLQEKNPGHPVITRILLEMYMKTGKAAQICGEAAVFHRQFGNDEQLLRVLIQACEEAGNQALADQIREGLDPAGNAAQPGE